MNMDLKDWGIGISITFGAWLVLPDILTRMETAVLVLGVGWVLAMASSDIRQRLRIMKAERDRLRIKRKPDNRSGKVIDFTPRRRKHLWFVSNGSNHETIVMM